MSRRKMTVPFLAAGMLILGNTAGIMGVMAQEEEVLIDLSFDDGTPQGFVSYTNGGTYDLGNQDGQLSIHITETGKLDYANQAYLDGFSMEEGCVYLLSFDACCDIDRKVEYRIQLNGGDYHAYVSDYAQLKSEMQHFEKEFTMMEASDPAPRFAFNMGLEDDMDGDPGEHTILYDNLKLVMTDSSQAVAAEGEEEQMILAVNQVGYRPEDKKTVVSDGSMTGASFQVVNTADGSVAFEGAFGAAMEDAATESMVCQGEFTELTAEGSYLIRAEKDGEQTETGSFEISDSVYQELTDSVFRMLTLQRCGTELDAELAGDYAHPACHTGEARIYGTDQTTDVTGGWHDAGDYGRYVVSGAQTVADLFYIYETGNGVQDLLDEARYELEWLLKMQDETSGGVYHKVTCQNFPGTVMPEEETEELVLSPVSAAATGDFAAVMAKAAEIYKEADPEFAGQCKTGALAAWKYLMTQEELTGFTNPSDIVTGEYPDTELDDEVFWAAVELNLLAELGIVQAEELEAEPAQIIKEKLGNQMTSGFGWADMGGFGLYDLTRTESEDLKELADNAKAQLLAEAENLHAMMEQDGYGCTLGTNYYWGSNMGVANNGMLFLMAKELSGDAKWEEAAKKQLDYLLGVNGNEFCYVSGFGTKSLSDPHHRPSQAKGHAMPGMLAGGPNANLEDPFAKQVLAGRAPGLCYEDNQQSYSVNEVAIYWNSPLLVLLAGIS